MYTYFKGGGLIVIFSGTSILRYELGVMGRASTDSLRVVWGLRAQCGPGGKKWPEIPKPE